MSIECSDCGNKVHAHNCRFHPENLRGKKMTNISKENYDKVNSTGEKRQFSTGSVRHSRKGKGRYDLIPPTGLRRLAVHYENGADVYGDRNWEKGQPLSSYIDSMLRHGQDYLSGDRSEDHLAAVAWNAFGAMHTEMMLREGKYPKEFADLPLAVHELPAWKAG